MPTKKKSKATGSNYRNFRLSKRLKHPYYDAVPKFRHLLKQAVRTISNHRREFALLALVHLGLIFIFVPLQTGFDVGSFRNQLNDILSGASGRVLASALLVGAVAETTANGIDRAAAIYGSLIAIIMSLAYFWALRHIWAKKKFTVKDAFYKGMYPIIPFVLVLFVLALQMLPLALATSFMTQLRANGLIVSGAETFIFLLLLLLVLILVGYWVTSTILATYAVSLPDMQPMAAMRAARKLVQHRRGLVFRRIVQIFMFMTLAIILLLLLVIQIVPALTFWFISAISIVALPLVHSYLYSLYRSLL